MEFGLFSASGYRQNRLAADTYDEDLYEIVMADRLGFSEAWLAENSIATNRIRPDIVTAANLLICKAAGLTKRIRLGTGIRPLPFYHPIEVLIEANTCDQLTHGRFMFGWGGTRAMGRDANRQRGIPEDADARSMAYESLDLLMRAWTSPEPFDFDGKYWQGKGICVQPAPYQKPHPPIAAACSGASETLTLAARYHNLPLLGRGNDRPEHIKEMGQLYRDAAWTEGWDAPKSSFRVTKLVYVTDSFEEAKDDLRACMTLTIEGQKRRDPTFLESCVPAGGSLDDVTFDYLADGGFYFIGDPDQVHKAIREFYAECGGFGVLVFAVGLPYGSRRKRARSMKLFMEHVAPKLVGLDPDGPVALTNGAARIGPGAQHTHESANLAVSGAG